MVKHHSSLGLIATARADVTPPLDDVVNLCGWPLLLDANPRRLAQELSHHDPQCVLFWLEERRYMPTLARLVGWSSQRGARPYRMAVAYRMESDVEAVFRAAGAHTFVPIAGDSVTAVADALRPLLVASIRAAPALADDARRWSAPEEPAARAPASLRDLLADLARPP